MRVLIICPYPQNIAPSQRFRFEQYLSFLSNKGIQVQLSPAVGYAVYRNLPRAHFHHQVRHLVEALIHRVKDITRAASFDVIVIHREAYPLGPPLIEKAIISRNPCTIFDFDDALHIIPESRKRAGVLGKLLAYLEYPQRTAEIVSCSSHVIAGNRFLQEWALQYNKNVAIVPTTVDTTHYQFVDRPQNRKVCIGWSGSYSTIQHLRTIEDVLAKVSKQYNVDIMVVGSSQYSIPGCNVIARDWNITSELDDFAAMDIGIMPLPDNEATRGKCALKMLLYMATGLPVICSPVGVNADIVQDGVNGFLAASKEEWYQKLTLLIENAELRGRLGKAGRETVVAQYSKDVAAPIFCRILEEAASSRNTAVKHADRLHVWD